MSIRSAFLGIPWYDVRRAARFCGYNWDEFCRLDGNTIASAIAEYRLATKARALVDAYQAENIRNKGKK